MPSRINPLDVVRMLVEMHDITIVHFDERATSEDEQRRHIDQGIMRFVAEITPAELGELICHSETAGRPAQCAYEVHQKLIGTVTYREFLEWTAAYILREKMYEVLRGGQLSVG